MSALPNCFKTDLFRKHLTSEILNSLWIMPYQSHCFALGKAETRSMQLASKMSSWSKRCHPATPLLDHCDESHQQVLPVWQTLNRAKGNHGLLGAREEEQQGVTWLLLDLFHNHNARGEKETGLFRCCCSVLSLTKAPVEVQADTSCGWFEMLS